MSVNSELSEDVASLRKVSCCNSCYNTSNWAWAQPHRTPALIIVSTRKRVHHK